MLHIITASSHIFLEASSGLMCGNLKAISLTFLLAVDTFTGFVWRVLNKNPYISNTQLDMQSKKFKENSKMDILSLLPLQLNPNHSAILRE